MTPSIDQTSTLAAGVLKGDVRAAAKAISIAEAGGEPSRSLMQALYPHSGGSHRIGLTGPPGAGKSTLAGQLAAQFRHANRTVGILAVDATSPFTGGALLGDRIRMQQHANDADVFIRSMGSGGSAGGMNRASMDAIRVMEAMGKGVVIAETAGVGQTEIEVYYQVDTTVVLLVPESGDEIQAMKAGVLEAADLVVVNKADRPGADSLASDLAESMGSRGAWEVPVLKVTARTGEGVDLLAAQIEKHAEYLERAGEGAARRTRQLQRELAGRGISGDALGIVVERILKGSGSPYEGQA